MVNCMDSKLCLESTGKNTDCKLRMGEVTIADISTTMDVLSEFGAANESPRGRSTSSSIVLVNSSQGTP